MKFGFSPSEAAESKPFVDGLMAQQLGKIVKEMEAGWSGEPGRDNAVEVSVAFSARDPRNAGIRTLLKQAGWEIVPQREGELSYVTSEVYAVEGAKGKAQHGVPTPDGLRQTIGLKKGALKVEEVRQDVAAWASRLPGFNTSEPLLITQGPNLAGVAMDYNGNSWQGRNQYQGQPSTRFRIYPSCPPEKLQQIADHIGAAMEAEPNVIPRNEPKVGSDLWHYIDVVGDVNHEKVGAALSRLAENGLVSKDLKGVEVDAQNQRLRHVVPVAAPTQRLAPAAMEIA
jgi:hypothetical protein